MKNHSTTNSIRRKISPLSIKIGAEQKDELTWIAQQKERSIHFLLCQAVTEYIEHEKKRLEFYEEARKSSEHYKKTGLHVTLEEMTLWAESLGAENELPLPPCHK